MSSSELQRDAAATPRFALPAIGLGIVLLVFSFLPVLAGGRDRWSKEQALEYQQASSRIQELTHDLSGQTPESASKKKSDEFRDALNHFENLQTQLKDARGRSGNLAAVLRVVGLVLLVGGVVGYVASKRKPKELRPIHRTS